MFEIEMLPARNGDALWVRWGKDRTSAHHLLIDCGFKSTYALIRELLDAEPELVFEAVCVTHIDGDHIEGAVHLFGDSGFANERTRDVWFNGWDEIDQLGSKQGEFLDALLNLRGVERNQAWKLPTIMVPDAGDLPGCTIAGMKLTLLSPDSTKLEALKKFWVKDLDGAMEAGSTDEALDLLREAPNFDPDILGGTIDVDELVAADFEEDDRAPNGSSIAFLAEYDGKKVLFGADAHPGVLAASLRRLGATEAKPLAIDVLKLSHHGSKNNTSPEMLQLVRPKQVLISSNGAVHHHPHAEALARVVRQYPKVKLVFNYDTKFTQPWLDEFNQQEHGYEAEVGSEGRILIKV